MNEIKVPHGAREELIRLFKTSYPTVRKALKGEGKSLLSIRIRAAALEKGGKEIAIVENDKKTVVL